MKNSKSLLFVTIDGGGNVPPMMAIAESLIHRGHQVAVLSEPCLEPAVEKTGAQFEVFKRYFTRTDASKDIFKDTETNASKTASMENVILGPSEITFSETLRVIDTIKPDLLIVDILLPAALMAAELRGIPRVVVFHMPEYLPGANRPPGMLGLTPGRGILGRWRDRLLGKLWNGKLNHFLPLVNDIRSKRQMSPLANIIDLLHQADLRLILTLPAFDFPIQPAPANVRYTGPIINDPHWAGEWQNPWPHEKDPLVVVAMSTTFMNQADTIRRCVNALQSLDVRGLVTTGPSLDPSQFPSTEKVKVVGAVPHSRIFPHASAVISHAGHGTMMRALAHGLPMVCMPIGRDQKDNAAKLEFHGCGIRLASTARAVAIEKAVRKVLDDPKFRTAAETWKHTIVNSSGADEAADLLEELSPAVNVPVQTV